MRHLLCARPHPTGFTSSEPWVPGSGSGALGSGARRARPRPLSSSGAARTVNNTGPGGQSAGRGPGWGGRGGGERAEAPEGAPATAPAPTALGSHGRPLPQEASRSPRWARGRPLTLISPGGRGVASAGLEGLMGDRPKDTEIEPDTSRDGRRPQDGAPAPGYF